MILYIGAADPPLFVSKTLDDAGYSVRAVEPSVAPDAMGADFGLVILDLGIPTLDAALCRSVGARAREQSIPLLVLGAGPATDPERLVALAGMIDAYVEPVFPPAVLVGAVRNLLEDGGQGGASRRHAERWRIALDTIRDGVCVLDAEGHVEHVNRALAKLLGRPVEDFAGLLHGDLFEGASEPAEGSPFDRVRRGSPSASSEFEWRGRWFDVAASPLLDAGCGFCGAVLTICDITRRKQNDRDKEELVRQVAAGRDRLEQVLRQLPLGVIFAEAPSGAIRLANEQVDRIWRDAPAPRQAFHPGGKPYTAEEWPLVRSLSAGEVVTDEEMIIARGDGTRGVVRVGSSPIRDEQGRIVAGVVAFYDITQSSELEAQLRQSHKMDALGRLAGGVAHDFNNLLTIIGGYAQMVADRLDSKDPVRRDVETVLEATERAVQLTRQLLTLSRRQIIQPQSLDINRLVTRMNKMLRRVIGEDIKLKTALATGMGPVKADPGQLEQVILNLALNARDAMPKGGRLTIGTSSLLADRESTRGHGVPAPGRYIVLSFQDTGTGIEPSVMSHLFEPFFTTKPKGKGTGLGLSTVYGIVKQAGGEIRVESTPGEGATFRIYLPEDERPQAPSRPGAASRSHAKGTETVLLVEDELEVRRLAREMLTRLGYKVLEAASAEDAVRAWERHSGSIDMLLTDVVMPQTSGRELADQLKAQQSNLKVLFMSGYTDEVIARHGAVGTGAAFLQKPFTQEQLAKKVRAILDAR